MKHLGDITKLKGSEVPLVDIKKQKRRNLSSVDSVKPLLGYL